MEEFEAEIYLEKGGRGKDEERKNEGKMMSKSGLRAMDMRELSNRVSHADELNPNQLALSQNSEAPFSLEPH